MKKSIFSLSLVVVLSAALPTVANAAGMVGATGVMNALAKSGKLKKQTPTPAPVQDQNSNGRALPSPMPSPPFPDSDWLGFPLIGAPWTGAPGYPLEKALFGDKLAKDNIHVYGWLNPSFNLSTSKKSNSPMIYDLVPNHIELDQAVIVAEKMPDTVQTSHVDWGFRSVNLYGTDYRYTIMKGVLSTQLLKKNELYGYDPVELYGILYLPKLFQGTVIRVGRYISPPDIEAQLTPDNYMFTHSMMFSIDPYTFMGVNAMFRLSKQWEVMAQVDAGNDMAVWSDSASPNFGLMARWASLDGKDGLWGGINSLGKGKVKDEHDDLQQVVFSWGHKFNEKYHMMTEAYYMWEYDANLGGTAIDGPLRPFGSGGGPGPVLPGKSDATGIVNYFQVLLGKKDYLSIRNDYLNDPRGYRIGFRTAYTSHTLGYVHYFNPYITFRPEIRYDHAWANGVTPFDNGTKRDQWSLSADVVFRF
jgi:hypothetical protein